MVRSGQVTFKTFFLGAWFHYRQSHLFGTPPSDPFSTGTSDHQPLSLEAMDLDGGPSFLQGESDSHVTEVTTPPGLQLPPPSTSPTGLPAIPDFSDMSLDDLQDLPHHMDTDDFVNGFLS